MNRNFWIGLVLGAILGLVVGGVFGSAKAQDANKLVWGGGDPASVADKGSLSKRLKATIERISAVPAADLKPNLATWQDMWGAIKAVAADDAKQLMEASKKALDDLAKKTTQG